VRLPLPDDCRAADYTHIAGDEKGESVGMLRNCLVYDID